MTIDEIISELEAVQRSIYVHPDRVPGSEFSGNVDRLNEAINVLKCYVGPTYPEPISGVQIGHTRARILGHDYVVRGADWNEKEIVLTPVTCA